MACSFETCRDGSIHWCELLVFVPVGVFLFVAAIQADPAHAEGLDQVLAKLSGHWWGTVLLAVVALGLLVFATYTFLEARYRKVMRAR
jgi:hypothetical protein